MTTELIMKLIDLGLKRVENNSGELSIKINNFYIEFFKSDGMGGFEKCNELKDVIYIKGNIKLSISNSKNQAKLFSSIYINFHNQNTKNKIILSNKLRIESMDLENLEYKFESVDKAFINNLEGLEKIELVLKDAFSDELTQFLIYEKK